MQKQEIWIATENKNKVEEFKKILTDYDVKSILDLPHKLNIKEDGLTFEDNALIKAKQLATYINKPTIADDSGLCITSMNNWPGIYSKRWAWPLKNYEKINKKLLRKMRRWQLTDVEDRKAQFVTVIAYFDPKTQEQECFTGVVNGYITFKPRGEKVFGYDQIFQVEKTGKTFSELGEKKNEYSHRRRAIDKMLLAFHDKYD